MDDAMSNELNGMIQLQHDLEMSHTLYETLEELLNILCDFAGQKVANHTFILPVVVDQNKNVLTDLYFNVLKKPWHEVVHFKIQSKYFCLSAQNGLTAVHQSQNSFELKTIKDVLSHLVGELTKLVPEIPSSYMALISYQPILALTTVIASLRVENTYLNRISDEFIKSHPISIPINETPLVKMNAADFGRKFFEEISQLPNFPLLPDVLYPVVLKHDAENKDRDKEDVFAKKIL